MSALPLRLCGVSVGPVRGHGVRAGQAPLPDAVEDLVDGAFACAAIRLPV
ncbi:hypothetical protein ACIQM3_34910 [Streptomyces sp. NPDC091271]